MPRAVPSERSNRLQPLADFIRTEAGGGVLLLLATVVALVWANSPWSGAYDDLWHHHLEFAGINEDLQHWVNDALMALFFFLAGLEIKRELVTGSLRDRRAAALPAVAALGGMVVPAAIFLALAAGTGAERGWGIPMATDIAFCVGVLALLGSRVPSGLKAFLLTLAIVDDIGAIVVIAAFYSSGVDGLWLAGAGASLVAVVALRRLGGRHPVAYVPIGLAAWYCTYKSGVHPTIAGVALGLLTPAEPIDGRPVLDELEHRLHPWSAYVVVPLFALANAGVDLGDGALADAATSRVTWAVGVALLVGKLAGIGAASWLSIRTGVGRAPEGVDFRHILGAAALGGIGFTVSLFVTGLAFDSVALQNTAKIGILAGSLAAAVVGTATLLRGARPAE